MGGSSSSSSSKSTTQNVSTSEDNRVGATDSGVAVGQGAVITITEAFPNEAVDIVNSLINLTQSSLDTALEAGKKAIETSEARAVDSQEATKKVMPMIIIGVGILAAVYLWRKK